MSWRGTGDVEAVIEVGRAGELQRRRNDYDNGDVFHSIWFYPRPAERGESYRPSQFYYVAWARVPAGYGGGPLPMTLHSNVADVMGMRSQLLPSLIVPDAGDIAPALELLGRGFAAAFDGRRPQARACGGHEI